MIIAAAWILYIIAIVFGVIYVRTSNRRAMYVWFAMLAAAVVVGQFIK